MSILNENNILVIIPAFNEEHTVGSVIRNVKKDFKGADILVVDDASLDGTYMKAFKNQAFVVKHAFNLGIGVSFQTGCQFACLHNYDCIVRVDADGQHDTCFIKDIVVSIKNNEADIVIGSRFLGDSNYKSSFFRLIGIRIISCALNTISKTRITDPTSGFCAMNRKAFEFFSRDCAEDYPEPEILLHHKNFRIKEVPVSMNKRYYGASSITFSKSVYYVLKVFFSLFVGMLR